jgi:uracil-DNA glycosylase family 4
MSEMNDFLSGARKFLEQQKDLFGDEALILSAGQPRKEVVPIMKKQAQENSSVNESLPAYSAQWPTLNELQKTVSDCTHCILCKTRTQTVFGSGNPNADILFIGEAPGADEDAQGLPFVGRAGQLLTKMIEEPRSLGLPRTQVYIANILKCRPPENRKPQASEIEQCEPYLIAQIENIKPKIICALGLTAANTLLKNTLSMAAMREKIFDYHGVPLVVTYHPAALLRNPNWKKPAWEDMIRLKNMITELKP